MASKYNLLKDINSEKEDWAIRVRLTRKWESINAKTNNLISHDIILLDQSGEHIHASILKYLTPKFSHLLNEGKVYTITTFRVIENKESYRPVSHQFKINFLPVTSVKEEEGEFSEIKRHKFEFVNLDTVKNRLNNDSQLSDVMGELTIIGPTEDQPAKGTTVKRKTIEIEGLERTRLQITLWAEKASKIDEKLELLNSDRLVAIVTSGMVKSYRGQIYLSSTSATKIYFNLDIPEVAEFMQNYQGTMVRTINPAPEAIKQLTISELLSLRSESDSEEIRLICNARITKIDTRNGWYYVSCKECRKKLTKVESSFRCDSCNADALFPTPRYRLTVQVQDETGSTTFVIFDKEAEKLLEIPISQIYNSDDTCFGENEDLPIIFNKIIGETYLFQLKLTSFNLKRGWENYTVTKILTQNAESSNSNIEKTKANVDDHPPIVTEEILTPTKGEEKVATSSATKRKNTNYVKSPTHKEQKTTATGKLGKASKEKRVSSDGI